MNQRYYHYHNKKDVQYDGINKKFVGFLQGKNITKHGCSFHYNYRCDPNLGIGYAAVQRIPCCCEACMLQLAQPWDHQTDYYNQPRYSGNNTDCVLWPLLGSYNNWKVVHFKNKKTNDNNDDEEDDLNASKLIALETMQQHTSHTIHQNNYGAIGTEDPNAHDGYYLVQWTSAPYNITATTEIDNNILQEGELVCDAVYLNPFARMSQWFTPYPNDEDGTTTVHISTVLISNVEIQGLS